MNVSLKMVRADLENLPSFPLPPGFGLRPFAAGDEETWRRIQRAADLHNPITPDLFARAFGGGMRELEQRQLFLLAPNGEAIGAGTAWFNERFQGARHGRVHWLAVVPNFQGRQLGKALLAAVCRRLLELGHDRAYLTTSSARIPAIKLYLAFGFVPLIENAEEEAAWTAILGKK